MLIGHYEDYHAYMTEAVRSGTAWSYGVVSLGDWHFMVPWAASHELLERFGLITFSTLRSFTPGSSTSLSSSARLSSSRGGSSNSRG